jgi:hypothetical protein
VRTTEYDPVEDLCSDAVVSIKEWESYVIMEKVRTCILFKIHPFEHITGVPNPK